MKLTISQEGMKPITIKTRSSETASGTEVNESTSDQDGGSEDDMSSMFGDDFFGEDTQGVEQEPENDFMTEEKMQQVENEVKKESQQQPQATNNSKVEQIVDMASKQPLLFPTMPGVQNDGNKDVKLSNDQISDEIENYTTDNERLTIENAYIDKRRSGSNAEVQLFNEINKREKISRAISKGYDPSTNTSRRQYVLNVLNEVSTNSRKALQYLQSKGAEGKTLSGFECFGIPTGTLADKVLEVLINGINGGYPIVMGLALRFMNGNMFNNGKPVSEEENKDGNGSNNGTGDKSSKPGSGGLFGSKNGRQGFQISKQQLAIGAGGAALAIIAAKLLGGTIYNHVTSIGNFKSGDEMIHSRTLEQKVNQLIKKYPNHPTIEKVKQDPRARSKSTFLGWLLGGSSNAKVINNIKSANMLIKGVSGVPVSVTSITPMTLNTNKILIATAYFEKEDGSIISVPLARGFLNKGYVVNYSKECSDIYFGMNNTRFNKKQIMRNARKTYEAFGCVDSIQKAIIDEYSI